MTVPDLPTVTHVEALPGRAARLTLDNGQTVTLSPALTPHLILLPITADGVPVLRENSHHPDAPAYRVPAALADVLDVALNLRPVVPPADVWLSGVTFQTVQVDGPTLHLTYDIPDNGAWVLKVAPERLTVTGGAGGALTVRYDAPTVPPLSPAPSFALVGHASPAVRRTLRAVLGQRFLCPEGDA